MASLLSLASPIFCSTKSFSRPVEIFFLRGTLWQCSSLSAGGCSGWQFHGFFCFFSYFTLVCMIIFVSYLSFSRPTFLLSSSSCFSCLSPSSLCLCFLRFSLILWSTYHSSSASSQSYLAGLTSMTSGWYSGASSGSSCCQSSLLPVGLPLCLVSLWQCRCCSDTEVLAIWNLADLLKVGPRLSFLALLWSSRRLSLWCTVLFVCCVC